MREIMVMNEGKVTNDGAQYIVISRLTKEVLFKTPSFKEVVEKLEREYGAISIYDEINEDEIRSLYFGFDSLRSKVDNYFKDKQVGWFGTTLVGKLRVSSKELEMILNNLSRFVFSHVEGNFKIKPIFRSQHSETFQLTSAGTCFFNPSNRNKQSKINNSYFSTKGFAFITLGVDSRSLEIDIEKLSRSTNLRFVPKKTRITGEA